MNALTHNGFGDGSPATMSTREIAELTSKQHAHVMRDTRVTLGELLGEEGLSKFGSSYVNAQNKVQPEYLLPKRECLILVSGYDVHLRARIIDRWQELEHRSAAAIDVRNLPQLQTITLQLIEVTKEQAEQIATLGPKANALDLLSASEGSVTFTQAAKCLGIKRDALTRWLHANGWIYRQNESWVAYSQHIQNRHLEYKEANYTDQKTGMKVSKPYCHLTQKGLAKLATIFASEVNNS